MKTNLAARLVEVARTNPTRHAISDSSGRGLTYWETLAEASGLAAWLHEHRANETNIGIYLPSSVAAAIANYAITLCGKVAVNLNFTAGSQNCRAAVDLCDIQTILTSRAFLAKLAAEPWREMIFLEDLFTAAEQFSVPEINPDATACILFSSGSTGIPKGIELTHWNVVANAQGLASRIPPDESDCVLGVLPFFHSFGYTFALWFPVLHAIRAVYHANPTDAKTIGDLALKHQPTYFFSTPTFCQQYARKLEPRQFASMKYIIVGAEKLRASVANEFRSHFGIELLAGYGCTELGPGVAINTPAESRPGSVGCPLEGIRIRIADPDTLQPLPASRQGMILVNGPSRMPGYYKSPEQTSRVIHDGFYVTGDLGYVDEDGYLYVTDRLARFSKIAGEMVPHLRIEEAVSNLTTAFVTGVPDDRRGERLVLLYTNPAATPDTISKQLSESDIPPLWIPKKEDMHWVEALPGMASGKLDLKQARQLAASRQPS